MTMPPTPGMALADIFGFLRAVGGLSTAVSPKFRRRIGAAPKPSSPDDGFGAGRRHEKLRREKE